METETLPIIEDVANASAEVPGTLRETVPSPWPNEEKTKSLVDVINSAMKPEEPKKLTVGGKEYTESELAAALKTAKIAPSIIEKRAEPCPSGHMRQARFWLQMNQFGSNIEILNATPAEVMHLTAGYREMAGRCPIQNLRETGFIEISPEMEKERLLHKYGAKVAAQFPGDIPQMPDSYERAIAIGMKAKLAGTGWRTEHAL